MKNLIFILLSVVLFSACQDEIDIDLNSSSPQLVVEAIVTNLPEAHTVKLSRTVNFSDANTFPAVSNALVIISDNAGLVDTLTETTPGLYVSEVWQGQPGYTYTLTITEGGKNYTSTSTMPALVPLDSIGFVKNEFNFGGGNEPAYFSVPKYTDPATEGNRYRFKLRVNSDTTDAILLFTDNVNNGQVNSRPIATFGNTDISTNDTVNIEMQCIDAANYLYLSALSDLSGGGPGGGVTPANPPTNITGTDVLGYFSAHTIQRMTTLSPPQ